MTIELISAFYWRQEGWYVSNFRAKTENQSRPKVGTKNVTGLMRPFESLSTSHNEGTYNSSSRLFCNALVKKVTLTR